MYFSITNSSITNLHFKSALQICRRGGFWSEVGIYAEGGKFWSEELLQGLENFPDTRCQIYMYQLCQKKQYASNLFLCPKHR